MNLVLLSVGGFLGAMARYQLSSYGNKLMSFIPFGTLMVNLLGSFLLGIVIAIELNSSFNALFATGFLGAFTTFSTMQTEAAKLFEADQRLSALIYLLVTFLAGTLFAALGYMIVSF
ncbi:fluoride efflux transporter CrcB [Jeotgalibacillus sp. JSM ZJ347]|uniref:fluoride efflux transporter CrcB n=1 Tax=Jeotgalibacillus sp. JSM ZJ347 TaxID=3342117 RepID=UPI0035A8863F